MLLRGNAYRSCMNRRDFQQLSRMRIREAKVLLDAGFYGGSYYLAGYAVECALKAIISRRTQRHDFPDKAFANLVHTHKLGQLLITAGLKEDMLGESEVSKLRNNWKAALAWSEEARYSLDLTESAARQLYAACADKQTGVLRWLRTMW